MNFKKIIPLNGKILVQSLPTEVKTPGGIVIAKANSQERDLKLGKVMGLPSFIVIEGKSVSFRNVYCSFALNDEIYYDTIGAYSLPGQPDDIFFVSVESVFGVYDPELTGEN